LVHCASSRLLFDLGRYGTNQAFAQICIVITVKHKLYYTFHVSSTTINILIHLPCACMISVLLSCPCLSLGLYQSPGLGSLSHSMWYYFKYLRCHLEIKIDSKMFSLLRKLLRRERCRLSPPHMILDNLQSGCVDKTLHSFPTLAFPFLPRRKFGSTLSTADPNHGSRGLVDEGRGLLVQPQAVSITGRHSLMPSFLSSEPLVEWQPYDVNAMVVLFR